MSKIKQRSGKILIFASSGTFYLLLEKILSSATIDRNQTKNKKKASLEYYQARDLIFILF